MADTKTPAQHPGTVYLLHFNEAIGNQSNRRAMARHYIGWSPDPAARIAQHTAGGCRAAKIVAFVQAQGIGFKVARTWGGSRALERQLKNRKNAPRICPECQTRKQA